MTIQLAQSLPTNSQPIQRTVVDEQDNAGTAATAQTPVQTQANSTVAYGLGAILLIVIAIGVAVALIRKK